MIIIMICLFVCLVFFFMLKLLQYCNYIIIVMQIKLMLLLLLEQGKGEICFGIVTSGKRCLFPFRKGSLPFLTVDATLSNRAFSHDRCNIFLGLCDNKENNTFLNSLRKNAVEAQVEFTLKVMGKAKVRCY